MIHEQQNAEKPTPDTLILSGSIIYDCETPTQIPPVCIYEQRHAKELHLPNTHTHETPLSASNKRNHINTSMPRTTLHEMILH